MPGSQPEREATTGTGPVLLRTAMLPTEKPQSFRIHLQEKCETAGIDLAKSPNRFNLSYSLDVTLTGSVYANDRNLSAGQRGATLIFDRIQIQHSSPGPPKTNRNYDSNVDPSGADRTLADLMNKLTHAELYLIVASNGRLRQLRGLDTQLHNNESNLDRAALQSLTPLRVLFSDLGMQELLAEALFPPMPASPLQPGDRWETDVPLTLYQLWLNSHLVGHLVEIRNNDRSLPIVHTEVDGTITPDFFSTNPRDVTVTIEAGTQKITQTVDWNAHALVQKSERHIGLALTTRPAREPPDHPLTFKQTRTLESERQ